MEITLALSNNLLAIWRLMEKSKLPTVVGHGANGLFVKAIKLSNTPWRVAFEAPALRDSPLVGNDADEVIDDITNIFTQRGIYARSDGAAAQNLPLPNTRFPWLPLSPLDVFCLVAAACEPDDGFAELCANVMKGDDAFHKLQDALGRTAFGANFTG
jgi:hypothetical protein